MGKPLQHQRYPVLPVTDDFRARLTKSVAVHGQKKPLADAVGCSPSFITRLLKSSPPEIFGSSRVQPICEYFGWPLPVIAIETDEDLALLMRFRLMDKSRRRALLAFVDTLAGDEEE